MLNNAANVRRYNTHADDGEKAQEETTPGAPAFTPPPRPLLVFFQSLALAPTLTLALVWTFSWRVASVIGYWPRPSLDDPKFVAPGDLVANVLYWPIWFSLLWSFVAMFTLPLLALVLWRSYSWIRFTLLLAIFGVAMTIVWLDPGSRLAWFGD